MRIARWALGWLLLVTACGRIGFDPLAGGGGSGSDMDVMVTPLGAPRSIAAGPLTSCAVLDDGSLWCWGSNHAHGIGADVTKPIVVGTQVGTDVDWAEVAVDAAHGCARKVDNSLWCWGTNDTYGLGNMTSTIEVAPIRVAGPADWTAIALGAGTCGMHGDRSVTCFGTWVGSATPLEIVPGGRFRELVGAAGFETYTFAIDDAGTLWSWWLGDMGLAAGPSPIGTDAWLHVAAWEYGFIGVRADGTLWTGGPTSPLQEISTDTGWTAVAAGWYYGCALKGTKLWCWGENAVGQHGDASGTSRAAPAIIDPLSNFAHVSSGGYHTCAERDGALACTGLGTSGQLGDGIVRWNRSSTLAGTWSSVDTGEGFSVGRRSDGTLAWWGNIGANVVLDAHGAVSPTTIGSVPVIAAATLRWGAVMIRTDGTLWRWGRALDTIHQDPPVQLGAAATWRTIDGGGDHACGLQADASLWCWGDNGNGTIGDGTTMTRTLPVRVGSASYLSVSTDIQGTCAVATDSTLWCWGVNTGGQPGGQQSSPRRIDNNAWSSVAVGTFRTCAIRADGTLWCWGMGPLGNGTTTTSDLPVAVGSATVWSVVSVGSFHTCAIKTDHTLWCWGFNLQKEVEDSDVPSFPSPYRIGTSSDWADVSAGNNTTCARNTAGEVMCWGEQTSLGDGRTWSTAFVSVGR